MKYLIAPFFKDNPPITQHYGENVDYYKQFGLQLGHEGVDYGVTVGTEIYSPFDGIILRDVDDPKSGAYGEYIVVWNPNLKCALWFCHLSDNLVSLGDTVKEGQLLAHSGNTGNSTGPHTHVNFVETDGVGNRLNTSNGNQGFLNLLDYVQFKDSVNVVQSDEMSVPTYFEQLLQERHLDLNNEGEIRAFFGNADAYAGLVQDLDSNKQGLAEARDQVAQLQSQVSNLDLTNHQLQDEVTTLKTQTNTPAPAQELPAEVVDVLKTNTVDVSPAQPFPSNSIVTVILTKLRAIWAWIIS